MRIWGYKVDLDEVICLLLVIYWIALFYNA